jgi:ureidoglycolate dehydrogenase (NAD+)
MTQLPVRELHELAGSALQAQGFRPDEARDVAREFVVAEVLGVRTHGVGKIASMNAGNLSVQPSITHFGAILQVDGNGTSGFLLMREVAQKCVAVAQGFGVAVASVRNFSRYSALYPYTEILARHGLVGILMNSAGPAAVAPHGSADPVTGTNPVCCSFDAGQGIQTIDLATSELVWGEIRQASLEHRPLPHGAFLDGEGEVTTEPADVNAVRAFGGTKGSALNVMVEVLAGLLTGARAGLAVKSEFDCGALLIALNPAALGADPGFPALVSDLLRSARRVRWAAPDRSGRRGTAAATASGSRRSVISPSRSRKPCWRC